ncbi:MAG TPA: hypothetical protein VIO12_02220 [Thermoanaerobaculia bacterium]
MKMKKATMLSLVLATVMSVSSFGAVKTYQVTGPVLEIRSDAIVVQKGKDRWEIARDGATRVVGNLKVGSKVTIEYRMTATIVNVK